MSSRVELSFARLHGPEHVPEIGNMPAALEVGAPGTIKIDSLTLVDSQFVEVRATNKTSATSIMFLVPVTNFRVMQPKEQ